MARYIRFLKRQQLLRILGAVFLGSLVPFAFAFLGDVNQDTQVTATDAQEVLESLVGSRNLAPAQQVDADVDGNGVVDVLDAQLIHQFAAGQISAFPVRQPYNSGPIAITRDGTRVGVVNPDNDTVTFLDTASDTVSAEIPVGREPSGIAFARDGAKAYVANARDRNLAVIDLARLTVVNRIPVGAEPFGVVVNFRGDRAYVSNLAASTVSVIDLRTETVLSHVPVPDKPQGLAVSADSKTIYVTHLNGERVSVINAATLAVSAIVLAPVAFDKNNVTRPAGVPNRMKGIVLHPTLPQAWLPHQLANSSNTVETVFNTTVFPAVGVIDTATNTELAAARMTLFSGLAIVTSAPEAMAFSPSGTLAYVASAASNDLSIINVATRQQLGLLRDVGDNPRGIVVNPAGTKAYIFNRLNPAVSVVNLTTETLQASVAVSVDKLAPNIARGRRLFFTTALPQVAQQRFVGCESCHFDGRDDGLTWFFTNGPRQTLSMAGGTLNTGLMHHNGDRANVQDFASTFTRLQNGTGLTPDELNDLADFVNHGIRFLDNPYLNADGSMTTSARAGRRVFRQAGCAACHAGPFFTDAMGRTDSANPLLHDVGVFAQGVGTRDASDRTRDQDGIAAGTVRPAGAFESTFLLGGFASAPYLHDGRALNLRDVLTLHNVGDKHGVTSNLTVQQLDQLVAYMQQLDITHARVRITSPGDGARVAGLATVSGEVLPEVQSVNVFINGAGPIIATITNGRFNAVIPASLVPALAAGARFDVTARATTVTGELGRDDVEVQANFGASADITTSSLSVDPAVIKADGSARATVTIIPRDNGNQLVGTGLVIQTQTTLGTLGPVVDNGDGTYQTLLTAATTAGTASVTANQQGDARFNAGIGVRFAAGDVDAQTSTVAVDASTLEGNKVAKTTVTIVPRDAFNNRLGSGHGISVSVSQGTVGGVTDQGDGVYTAQYTAPAALGNATLTVTVNGVVLNTKPQITLINDSTPPPPTNLGAISFSTPTVGVSVITGGAGSVEPFATVRVENVDTGAFIITSANADGSFSVSLAVSSNHTLRIRVVDLAGNAGTDVTTQPFIVQVFAVRGLVQVPRAGGGFNPLANALVELDVADLTNPLAPGFSPVFGGGTILSVRSGTDGRFEIILPTGFVPDPNLAVVTGPDANADGVVDAITDYALVNDISRQVIVDNISTSMPFLMGSNDLLLGNAPPAFPASHFTPAERAAVEAAIRAATTERNFINNDAQQQIADDVFFDVDGLKDALDTVAYATFKAAAESPGQGSAPVVIKGRLTAPSATGDVALVGVTVELATLSFLNPPQCTNPICVAPIAGYSAVTDAAGNYSVSVPAFVVPGSTAVVIVVGDLTYNAVGTAGPFNGAVNVFSLGGFVTHPEQAQDLDLAGRIAMNLIQSRSVPIGNFNPNEMRDLAALVRTRLPAAGLVYANRTLQQVFSSAYNAMLNDIQVTTLLQAIADPESGLDNSRVTVSPASLEANGVATSVVTIEPLDASSQRVGAGLVVNVSTTLGSVTTPAIDNGNGLYTAYLTAPTTTGVARLVVKVEGNTFSQQPQVTFTSDVTAPVAPDVNKIKFFNVGVTTTVIGLPGAAEPGSWVTIENTTRGTSVRIRAAMDGSFRADIAAGAGDQLRVSSSDAANNTSATTATAVTAGLSLPAVTNAQVLPTGTVATITPLASNALGVPLPAGYTVLRAFSLGLNGARAGAPLEILINSDVAVPANQQILLVEAIEVLQAPALRVIAAGLSAGGVLFPSNAADFPGITQGGRYAFVAAANPIAFVHGQVQGNRGALSGVHLTLPLSPFVDLSRTDGRYLLAGGVGSTTQMGVRLWPHEAVRNVAVQLPYARALVPRPISLSTRANRAVGFTGRFTGVGQVARNLALEPSGDRLHVVENNVSQIAVLDTQTLTQVTQINDAQVMNDMTFSPNGEKGFIAYLDKLRDLTVNIRELGITLDKIGYPRTAAVTPNGELALIAVSVDNNNQNTVPDKVYLLDTFTNKIETTALTVPADPTAIVVNRAGTRAYVVSRTQGSLTIIDIAGRAVLASIPIGTAPASVAVSADNAELYVADIVANNVKVLDAARAEDAVPDNETLAIIAVGTAPTALTLTPDGNGLLVAEQQDDTVTLVNLTTRVVASVWAAVDIPFDIAVHPSGKFAYVLDSVGRRGVLEVPLQETDSVRPVVIDVGPADRAGMVLQDSPVEIVFSEKMDATMVDATSVQILDANNAVIPGTLAIKGNGVAVVFTPATTVRYILNSQLTVVLNTSLRDVAGNSLAATVSRQVPTQVMQLPNLLRMRVDLTTGGIIATGTAGAVEPNSTVEITNPRTRTVFRTTAAADGGYSVPVSGLDSDGFQLVTSLYGGRARTNPIVLPVNYTIVVPDPAKVSYVPGLAGTLNAVGAVGTVDPKTTLIRIRNVTSQANFDLTTINPNGSFLIPIFAAQGDTLQIITTLSGAVILDPVPLAVATFARPVIDVLTPNRFVYGDAVTVTVIGANFGTDPATILLKVGDVTRTDFVLDTVIGTGQQALVVTLPPGTLSGVITVGYAGQSSAPADYAAQFPPDIGPHATTVVSASITGNPNDAVGNPNLVYASLGAGGQITLGLGVTVRDGPGDDFTVYEDTRNGVDCYQVLVSAGSTGPFDSLGTYCGTRNVDLNGHGPVRFVRIVDAADGGNAAAIDSVTVTRKVMKIGIALVDASDNVLQTVGASPAGEPMRLAQRLTLAPRSLPASRRLTYIASLLGISPALAAISVTIPPPDKEICQNEEVKLKVIVDPPLGAYYYGPKCEDNVTWKVEPSDGGTVEKTGTYTATFTGGTLKIGEKSKDVTITADVKRTGDPACADEGKGGPVNIEIIRTEHTITLTAFLPTDWVPGYVYRAVPSLNPSDLNFLDQWNAVIYGGDNRGQDCARDFAGPHTNYRMWQQVKVEACKSPKGGQRVIGTTGKDVSASKAYWGEKPLLPPLSLIGIDALPDCDYRFGVCVPNTTTFLKDAYFDTATWPTSGVGDCTVTPKGDKKINVNCPGAVGNPIPLIGRFCPSCSGILAAPESDWNYTLEVDVKDLKNHKYKFVNGGDHDGMPSYEICMKDKPIYYRPAPGYSFNNFLSMFPPKEIDFVDHGDGTADIESGMP